MFSHQRGERKYQVWSESAPKWLLKTSKKVLRKSKKNFEKSLPKNVSSHPWREPRREKSANFLPKVSLSVMFIFKSVLQDHGITKAYVKNLTTICLLSRMHFFSVLFYESLPTVQHVLCGFLTELFLIKC